MKRAQREMQRFRHECTVYTWGCVECRGSSVQSHFTEYALYPVYMCVYSFV